VIIIIIIGGIVNNYNEKIKYKKSKKMPLQKGVKRYKQASCDTTTHARPELVDIRLKECAPPICDIPFSANEGIAKWDKAFLKELEWKLFEDVCMEYLILKNCDAKVTSIGADGGMDMKVSDKNGNVIAVAQCKSWDKPIGVNLIRELYGVMAAERVKHGIFLTTSTYTNDAKTFAKGKALILIDGEEFVSMINGLEVEDKKKIDKLIDQDTYKTPTCVNCNIKLVKRTTKKGLNAGHEFWGCINYPKCKVTMHVRKDH